MIEARKADVCEHARKGRCALIKGDAQILCQIQAEDWIRAMPRYEIRVLQWTVIDKSTDFVGKIEFLLSCNICNISIKTKSPCET